MGRSLARLMAGRNNSEPAIAAPVFARKLRRDRYEARILLDIVGARCESACNLPLMFDIGPTVVRRALDSGAAACTTSLPALCEPQIAQLGDGAVRGA